MSIPTKVKKAKKTFKRIYKRCLKEGDEASIDVLFLVRNYGEGILINYPDTKGAKKIQKKISALNSRIDKLLV